MGSRPSLQDLIASGASAIDSIGAGPQKKAGGSFQAPAFAARHTSREGMNATEAEYAAFLDRRTAAGEVRAWAFEAVRIRVAGDSWYKPDFLVQLPDGSLELHEVKGFMTEAARLRVKSASERFPAVFRVVRKVDGHWQIREIRDGREQAEDGAT